MSSGWLPTEIRVLEARRSIVPWRRAGLRARRAEDRVRSRAGFLAGACGVDVTSGRCEDPRVLVCPHCGEENPERARFCLTCGQLLVAETPAGEERKVVSVLFVDLVGFTNQSDRADPEDVRATLRPYHERVKTDIERFGGEESDLKSGGFNGFGTQTVPLTPIPTASVTFPLTWLDGSPIA